MIFHFINQCKKTKVWSPSYFSILSLSFNDWNRPYIIVMGIGLEIIFNTKVSYEKEKEN